MVLSISEHTNTKADKKRKKNKILETDLNALIKKMRKNLTVRTPIFTIPRDWHGVISQCKSSY